MFRTFIWFLYLTIYVIGSIPQLFNVKHLIKKGEIEKSNRIITRKTKSWTKQMLWLAGARVKVKGLDNIPKDTACVFVGNHQGNFDFLMFLRYFGPIGFIAKKEILKVPVIRSWMKVLDCVFLDRKDARQSLAAINKGAELIKNGYSMAVFPEGTRSKSTKLGEFKKGSLKLAIKAGVPIVPVALNGTYKLFEEHNRIIKPADVTVNILKPVYPDKLTVEDRNNLIEYVKALIEKGIE